MLLSTCTPFWERILDSVLPLVDALGLIMLAWVASRLRTTSQDVQWTSRVSAENFVALHRLLGRNVSLPVAPARRKSSTKETTSTSPGDDEPNERSDPPPTDP